MTNSQRFSFQLRNGFRRQSVSPPRRRSTTNSGDSTNYGKWNGFLIREAQIPDSIPGSVRNAPKEFSNLAFRLHEYCVLLEMIGAQDLHFQLSPVEILGPMFKNFGAMDVDELLAPKLSEAKQEVSASEQMMENVETTCDFEGENRKTGDVWVKEHTAGWYIESSSRWVSDGIFTKKCTEDGATVILNCIVDDKTIINVDTELTIGKKVRVVLWG